MGFLKNTVVHGRMLPWTFALVGSALLVACGGGQSSENTATASASAADSTRATILAANTETALTPVSATASSLERGDLSADKAIDHNDGTRWGSGFTNNEWLTLDFGASVSINRVKIQWENAHASSYQLQTSEDGLTWTTLRAVDKSAGGTEDLTALGGQGRYLRMQGLTRSTSYGYSIFEIQAFSGAPVETTPPQPPVVDTSQPGVLVKPVLATASSAENGGLAADKTIDGNTTTRWSSKPEDGAWIAWDFGTKVQLGYMSLLWENAYGKAYNLQVSDDGTTWTLLREVINGKGGTEEFYNLGVTTRFVRLQGVARATQYGYSLFEVQFKTPGSDNSIPTQTTSALPVPPSGQAASPLFQPQAPLETVQFTLADGTIVTRFGNRGVGRHGRERGEEWNEIGYGPNETVDPATGLEVDKGPGAYLTFVPQYFQNRTWGLEIIDNSRVAGVTKPQLKVNTYNQIDNLPGGIAFFRGFDRPGVTGYGWMAPGALQGNPTICPPNPYPADGQLGKDSACTLVIKDYPGHAALDANGFPNGQTVAARPLVAGDVIEVAPSMFSTTAAMQAKGDNGGVRYYANEWVYVVGQGLAPWYGIQPRLNSVPLPAETLSGGLGSVSYNYSDEGFRMFMQPDNRIGMQNMQRFVEGRRVTHSSFLTGAHTEAGNDVDTAIKGLTGPRFNQTACVQCHTNNGRSPALTTLNQRLDTMSIHTGVLNAKGQVEADPRYGVAIQMNGVSASGAPQDWGNGVRVTGFTSTTAKLADGTSVELRKPTVGFDGPVPKLYSVRSAQPMIGAGLLEAVNEADILARARATPDEDGVVGRANYVYDPETGAVRLGRFGWKAAKVSVRHQAAGALLQDMSVTSSVYPNRSCLFDPASCHTAAVQKGISETDLVAVVRYVALLAVPAQRSLSSGFPKGVMPMSEHRVDPVQIQAGRRVFDALRCAACHTAEMKTGNNTPFAELRGQTIRPFTDLLLHDMGPALADNLPEGQALGAMWRTAPLWGIGYTEKVQGGASFVGYLHDGRARTLTEAVMWHGGEAEKSRQRFEKLAATDRDALMAFLRSL
ncbi:CxxC motif-containing protein, DUF1111 family [Roseateles sp. YR242]|uniref:di-heme oxidoredictase family protein n=1 Tax=Roseateles sp. YR242 TaxID=1855305 RepID=UPI0008D64031|nr:di-heme oxidoredictase family protein [Roseateles sp. YR242]SEL89061.1 CxxC motif-containing protein, DUF1111 family [Roseateles sp. YR242]